MGCENSPGLIFWNIHWPRDTVRSLNLNAEFKTNLANKINLHTYAISYRMVTEVTHIAPKTAWSPLVI